MTDFLQTDTAIEDQGDVLGGGFLVESGIYEDAVIDMAYLDVSGGGANSLNITLTTQDGASVSESFWLTSGTAKGCKNYYLDKKTQAKRYLPGFSMANHMCLLAVGKEISELVAEEKIVEVYNSELGKRVPTAKKVFTELLGQPITAGVIKQIVDKNIKNPNFDPSTPVHSVNNPKYITSGETREENTVDKFFRAKDGLTVAEIRAGATEPAFKDKWAEKNTGVTRNKAKGATANTTPAVGGVAGNTGASPTKSLFG